MVFLTNIVALLWLCLILVTPVVVLMPFYMAAKARGIEKALNEIAFEIRVARMKEESSVLTR